VCAQVEPNHSKQRPKRIDLSALCRGD
jgi:hypothetical protein